MSRALRSRVSRLERARGGLCAACKGRGVPGVRYIGEVPFDDCRDAEGGCRACGRGAEDIIVRFGGAHADPWWIARDVAERLESPTP